MAISAGDVIFKIRTAGDGFKKLVQSNKLVNAIKKKGKNLEVIGRKGVAGIKKTNEGLKRIGKTLDNVQAKAKKFSDTLKKSRVGRVAGAAGRGAGRVGRGVSGFASGGTFSGLAGATFLGGAIAGISSLSAKFNQSVESAAATIQGLETSRQRARTFGLGQGDAFVKKLGKAFGEQTSLEIGTAFRSSFGKLSKDTNRRFARFAAQSPGLGAEVAGGNLRAVAGDDIQKNILADVAESLSGDYISRSLGLADRFVNKLIPDARGDTSVATRILKEKERGVLQKASRTLSADNIEKSYRSSIQNQIDNQQTIIDILKTANDINNGMNSRIRDLIKIVKVGGRL